MDDWPGGKLKGYSPFVIYLDVVVSPDLQRLAEELEKNVIRGRDVYYKQPWPFHPHLTIAFKDLTKGGFLKARKLLENEIFSSTILVDHVAIIKETSEGKFVEYKRFNFEAH